MNELTPTDLFTVANEVLRSPLIQGGFILCVVLFVLSIPSTIREHLEKLEKENFSGGKMDDKAFQSRLAIWRSLWMLSYLLFRIVPGILGYALLRAYLR